MSNPFNKRNSRRRPHQSRRPLLIVGIVLVLGGFLGGLTAFLLNNHVNTTSVTPSFTSVTPNGVSVTQKGGWERISPESSDAVYAYADTIGGIAVTVSEQTLPETFLDNTATKIADLAKSYNATNKITADSTAIYIGTNANGPQTVIFTKNQLLIMIKSEAVIQESDWTAYVQSLQ
jgi:cytoskeletal protein RodZ